MKMVVVTLAILSGLPLLAVFTNASPVTPAAPTANLGQVNASLQVDFAPAIYVTLSSTTLNSTIVYAIDSRFLPVTCDGTDPRNHILYKDPIRIYHPGSVWAVTCVGQVASAQVEYNYTQEKLVGRTFTAADDVSLPYRYSSTGTLPLPTQVETALNYPFNSVRVNPYNLVPPQATPQYASFVLNHCSYAKKGAAPADPDSCVGGYTVAGPRANTNPNGTMPAYGNGIWFNSYRKADACTMAQTARVLGYSDTDVIAQFKAAMAGRVAAKDPIPAVLVSDDTVADRNQTLINLTNDNVHYDGKFYIDTCVLPIMSQSADSVAGVWLDDEAHDGRDPVLVHNFFADWAAMVHGANRKAILTFDFMDSNGQLIGTGTKGNNLFLLNTLDKVNFRFSSDDHTLGEFQSRMNSYINLLLTEDSSVAHPVINMAKAYLHLELANLDGGAANPTSLAGAQAMRTLMFKYHVPMMHTGGAQVMLGGTPSRDINKIIDVLTAPVINVTNPVSGRNVTGNVNLSVAITDVQDIRGVQYKIDNVDVGAEVTTPPYSMTLNTATIANGTHRLRAVVHTKALRQAVGNGILLLPSTSASSAANLLNVRN